MVDADDQKPDAVSLTGPVERINGELTLRIPLDAGGAALAPAAARIGTVDEKYLNIVMKPWLADQLGISEGSLVDIDNVDGRLNIRTVATLRLSMDHDTPMAPESAHGDIAERLMAALATCLSPHLPARFSLEANDGGLRTMFDGDAVGGTYVAFLLEGLTPSPAHLASVALNALSHVQDVIAIELTTPWPAHAHLQPMPNVRVVEGRIYLWFGDAQSPVLACEPIALGEVVR